MFLRSLSNKVLTVVALSCTLLMMVWGWIDYKALQRRSYDEFRNSAMLSAERLAHSLIYPVWNLSGDEIDKSIVFELRQPEVQAITLKDDSNSFIAGKLKLDNQQIISIPSEKDAEDPLKSKELIQISRQIVKFNQNIATVNMYISDKHLKTKLHTMAKEVFVRILAIAGLISLTIFISLRWLIIRPLTVLEEGVNEITLDNLTLQIPVAGDDEISRVARSFAKMAAELNSSFRQQETLLADLIERDERFRSIVSNVPGAIYRIRMDTDDHELLFISDNIKEISGFPPGNFINSARLNIRDIIIDSDRRMVMDAINEALKQKRSYDISYRIIHSSGGYRWLHETGQPLADQQGTVQWLDGILVDTTEMHSKDEQSRTREFFLH